MLHSKNKILYDSLHNFAYYLQNVSKECGKQSTTHGRIRKVNIKSKGYESGGVRLINRRDVEALRKSAINKLLR